jgi:hypothetical protein
LVWEERPVEVHTQHRDVGTDEGLANKRGQNRGIVTHVHLA